MSIVEERYSLALERSIGTDNSYAVVTPLNPNEIDVEPKWWESSADALIPLFEPGFGSTSTIAVGAVTVGNAMPRKPRERTRERIGIWSGAVGATYDPGRCSGSRVGLFLNSP